ncbi:MAG: hypothetical protein AA908_08010 [Chlorobi bacterium NICIL-2]|nr:MAG: hypothetical protein AA908_08010 [Chlorobi bacterium NICIL-2]
MMRLVLLAVLSTLAACGALYSQSCCGGTGTFLGGTERGALPAGTMTAAAVYAYTAMDRTLNGSQAVADPYQRRAWAHSLNLELELSPLRQWSVLVVLPLTDKARWVSASGTAYRYHAAGLSDAFGIVKYTVVPPSPLTSWTVALGIGAKAPTGDYRRSDGSVELPLDVQPGTSTWDALAWGLCAYRFDEPEANAALSILVRQPGTNVNGRTMGTDVQALLALSTTALDLPVVPLMLTRWRWTAPDRIGETLVSATGTFRVELLPAVALTLWEPFIVRIGAQLPLYEHTNGIQLVPSWGVFGELRTTISLW